MEQYGQHLSPHEGSSWLKSVPYLNLPKALCSYEIELVSLQLADSAVSSRAAVASSASVSAPFRRGVSTRGGGTGGVWSQIAAAYPEVLSNSYP